MIVLQHAVLELAVKLSFGILSTTEQSELNHLLVSVTEPELAGKFTPMFKAIFDNRNMAAISVLLSDLIAGTNISVLKSERCVLITSEPDDDSVTRVIMLDWNHDKISLLAK